MTQVRKLAIFRPGHLTSIGNVDFINAKETLITVRHWVHLCVLGTESSDIQVQSSELSLMISVSPVQRAKFHG